MHPNIILWMFTAYGSGLWKPGCIDNNGTATGCSMFQTFERRQIRCMAKTNIVNVRNEHLVGCGISHALEEWIHVMLRICQVY